jgi:hypothetical protein
VKVRLSWVLLLATACCGQEKALWRNPGAIEKIDFGNPTGIYPAPPFTFESESLGGTSPKLIVHDRTGTRWRLKGGYEVKSESFATRLVNAVGYYASPNYFLKVGKVLNIPPLTRAAGFIHSDGSFVDGAFELRTDQPKSLDNLDWTWEQNPFVGSKELNGLKVLMMLLSNWDNKDARDRRMGSNTGIVAQRYDGGILWIYFVTDWGQTLGAWGAEQKPKGWDCVAFSQQSQQFVIGTHGDQVRFGFEGQHSEYFKSNIHLDDVRWLLRMIGKITDMQLRSGLTASGASDDETKCFTTALRQRIDQLKRVTIRSSKTAVGRPSAMPVTVAPLRTN